LSAVENPLSIQPWVCKVIISLFHFWVRVPPSDVVGPTRAGISRPSSLSVFYGFWGPWKPSSDCPSWR